MLTKGTMAVRHRGACELIGYRIRFSQINRPPLAQSSKCKINASEN